MGDIMTRQIMVFSVFMVCLMFVAPMMNVTATGMKLDESFIGQKQTASSGQTKDFYLHVSRGDNVSFESVKLVGTWGYYLFFTSTTADYLYFSESFNDTFISWSSSSGINWMKLWSIWFIPSIEDIIKFTVFVPNGAGASLDFYINRTNVTSNDPSSKIAELEKSISSMNSTVNNLTKSISLINVRIGALSDTTNSSILEVNNWISQLRNETNILTGRLNNLSIPKEVNLTNLYNEVNTLSGLVSSLQENISRLSVITNTTIYVNTTTIKNETHSQSYYFYDNATLSALKKNITESMKNIQEIEKTIGNNQNETGQVASNVTNLETKVNTMNSTRVEKTEIKKYQTITMAEAQNYAIIGILIAMVVCFAIWNVILTHGIKTLKQDKELEKKVQERMDEVNRR